jgi:hypothetical protein
MCTRRCRMRIFACGISTSLDESAAISAILRLSDASFISKRSTLGCAIPIIFMGSTAFVNPGSA